MEIVGLKMQFRNALSPPQKSQRNMFTLALLRTIRNQKYKNDTALSTFLLELKKSTKETPKLTRSVLKVVPGYSNISKQCLLCFNEKLLVATYPDQKQLLN